jgi:hypothetical protein
MSQCVLNTCKNTYSIHVAMRTQCMSQCVLNNCGNAYSIHVKIVLNTCRNVYSIHVTMRTQYMSQCVLNTCKNAYSIHVKNTYSIHVALRNQYVVMINKRTMYSLHILYKALCLQLVATSVLNVAEFPSVFKTRPTAVSRPCSGSSGTFNIAVIQRVYAGCRAHAPSHSMPLLGGGGGVTFTTHLHLAQRLKKSAWSYTSTSRCLHSAYRDYFNF